MKSAIFATLFAVAIASVSAQTLDISAIPTCAAACAFSSIASTVCSTSDFACICKDSKFITTLQPCISSSCDPADQTKILTMATVLCSGFGVTIPTDILSANTTTNATVTAPPSTSVTSTTPAGTSSTGGAVRMAGSGFVAAAMGAALFVL